MKKVLIIGAGGVTSYLLPVFLKTFRDTEVVLMDGDKLEVRNLDRQMFDIIDIGLFKAQALATKYNRVGNVESVNTFFTGECHDHQFDAIICCADNHEARKNALNFADERRIPAYIGGNEYFDSQAMFYHPTMLNTPHDPRIKFPNIMTDKSGSPVSCQGAEQESSPQLAVANFACAAFLMQLLWIHVETAPTMEEEYKSCLPVELYSTVSGNHTTQIKDA